MQITYPAIYKYLIYYIHFESGVVVSLNAMASYVHRITPTRRPFIVYLYEFLIICTLSVRQYLYIYKKKQYIHAYIAICWTWCRNKTHSVCGVLWVVVELRYTWMGNRMNKTKPTPRTRGRMHIYRRWVIHYMVWMPFSRVGFHFHDGRRHIKFGAARAWMRTSIQSAGREWLHAWHTQGNIYYTTTHEQPFLFTKKNDDVYCLSIYSWKINPNVWFLYSDWWWFMVGHVKFGFISRAVFYSSFAFPAFN